MVPLAGPGNTYGRRDRLPGDGRVARQHSFPWLDAGTIAAGRNRTRTA